MKPTNPNPLLQALAKGAASKEHPDPDLLTAFAEGSLLARERESVVAHLARCAECREVLSLSAVVREEAHEFELVAAAGPAPVVAAVLAASPAPAADEAVRKSSTKTRRWLPWAAVAACIAIVSVATVRFARNKPEQIASAPESRTASVAGTPIVPGPAPAAAAPVPDPRLQSPRGIEKKARTGSATALRQVSPQIAASQNAAQADRQLSSRQTTAGDRTATEIIAAEADSIRAQNAPPEPQKLAPRESAQMALHGLVMQPAPIARPTSTGGPRGLTPSLAGSFAKSANMSLVTRPNWRINDDGRVERAFGDGPWQPVLTNETAHMRVVSVAGADVWAGGDNEVLYRSQDDGATWLRIALPQKNGAGHAIAHIRFANAATGTIEAEDGTTWTTADGGSAWQ